MVQKVQMFRAADGTLHENYQAAAEVEVANATREKLENVFRSHDSLNVLPSQVYLLRDFSDRPILPKSSDNYGNQTIYLRLDILLDALLNTDLSLHLAKALTDYHNADTSDPELRQSQQQ